jgi:ABC-2 type transport system permease protein
VRSSLSHIIMKEVKELLTPATLIPIIIFAIIFGSLGTAFGGATNQLSEPPTLGIINQDNSTIGRFVYMDLQANSKVVYNGTDVQAGIQAVTDQNGAALIVITSDFGSNITQNESGVVQIYWIMRGTGILDSFSSATADAVLAQVQKDLSKALIDSHADIDSTIILNPVNATQNTVFKGKEMAGISPTAISAVMSGQNIIVPLIVVMVVIYAGTMVVTSMGSEKENKTLETLLTLPVRRSSIVFGKLAGAAIVGLVFAAIYMIGMGYYMSSLTFSSSIDLAQYGISLNLLDYVLVGISLFLALLFALGLCMILGIFTKNYKAAQTMTLPVTMLALIPMFVLMFTDFNTLPLAAQVFVFAIPFSQPIIAMNSLMFGQVAIVLVGIAYEIVVALVTIFIAVYLFKKDILLTGRVKSAEAKRRGTNSLWTMMKRK